ncbi:MAG: signal peptide peptidase SppA [Acidobacteria bacterium]|nr:signal peptide peptidase SppA [Acidobacteriota bacterium]
MDPVIEPRGEERFAEPAPAEPASHAGAGSSPSVGAGFSPSQPPPTPPRKSRAPIFFFGAFSGCLVVVVAVLFLAGLAAAMSDSNEMSFGDDRVAVVPIEGEIVDAREAVDALHKYANNKNVKAIVMRINSPGGAIAPSQEIYEEIRKTRQRSGKPIIASMDSVAASGGFYIAVACDRIVANPGSITGSIGVILQWMNTKDLLAWAKLKPETITSGAMKAAGSPYSDMTDAERAYFQRIVTQLHGQFVKAVAEGRKGKISEAEVGALADGRVFTGEEALTLKLIDELGNLDDAVHRAAQLGGIKGEPTMLYPRRHKGSLLDILSDSGDAESMIERIVSRRLPTFLYRW